MNQNAPTGICCIKKIFGVISPDPQIKATRVGRGFKRNSKEGQKVSEGQNREEGATERESREAGRGWNETASKGDMGRSKERPSTEVSLSIDRFDACRPVSTAKLMAQKPNCNRKQRHKKISVFSSALFDNQHYLLWHM
jgi:hypothetical protein